MATLPKANTIIQASAGAPGAGSDLICVWAPVLTSADYTPRLFGNISALLAQHGYCEGAEFVAYHIEKTRKPVLFQGLPIATPGVVGRLDTSGNSGTSTVGVVALSGGVLSEHDGVLKCLTGGTVGTDQILLELSLDGDKSVRRVRLGTAALYDLPYVNVRATFGAGTLVAGDTLATWKGSAPRSDATGWAAAKEALKDQPKLCRTILLAGDLQDSTEASGVNSQIEAFQTANERFAQMRVSLRDRLPLASLAKTSWAVVGAPSLTYADADDTITRSAGSWLADGAVVGDRITVAGSSSNDGSYLVTDVTATVLTVESDDLADEVTANSTVTGQPALTFADTGETVTRNRGSWLDDGFRVGDSVTITGSAGGTNDGTFVIQTLTALVMTLDTGDVDADESIGVNDLTVSVGQTKAAWMADLDAAFESIDGAERIDMAAGRRRELSPLSSWYRRCSAAWFAAWREFQHDVHIPVFRKDDGPVSSDVDDSEWDDRVDGEGASAARFTSFRTWANGPQGAFLSQSLTRAGDGSILSRMEVMHVVNVAATTAHSAAEAAIGRSLVLNDDNTATTGALNTIRNEVNAKLHEALLKNRGEGPRASSAVWTPNSDDNFGVAEPTLTAVLELNVNGVVFKVNTVIRVR